MEFIITRKKLEKKVSFDKIKLHQAEVAKSVDAPDSKSGVAHPFFVSEKCNKIYNLYVFF